MVFYHMSLASTFPFGWTTVWFLIFHTNSTEINITLKILLSFKFKAFEHGKHLKDRNRGESLPSLISASLASKILRGLKMHDSTQKYTRDRAPSMSPADDSTQLALST